MRLAQKLVINTSSSDDADLGRPAAFQYCFGLQWAICGTRIFVTADALITSAFTEDTTSKFSIGMSDTQFDVTNPAGTTFRYTYDGNGTDPGITALTFPIGAIVTITGTQLNAANRGTFTVTGSGANYFEVTNAAGVAEVDKQISTGSISVSGGSYSTMFDPDKSDMKVFDDRLWVTSTYGLYSKSSATSIWTLRYILNGGAAFSSHQMVYFNKFNRLYFKDSNSIINSIDVDNVVAEAQASDAYAIDLGDTVGNITCLAATSEFIWIGTKRNTGATTGNGTYGQIETWDGFSAQITADYIINAANCLALLTIANVIYAMDSEARVLKYTGFNFAELSRLPVNRVLLDDATASVQTNGRFVHYNGMVGTKNNTILIGVDNKLENSGVTIEENLASGLWELDLSTNNFTHRYSFTLKARSSSTVTDYGQNRILGIGAVQVYTLAANSTAGRSTIICGASYYTNASSTASAIFIDSPAGASTDNEGQKRGYFVTTWFNSQEIQDKWERIWTTYRRFLNSSDKIIFKYRLNEETPVEATITWTSTTTFTTTTNISAYAPTATGFNGVTGGEVEVVQGTGSGACVHITNVSENGGTYTVTIDNAIPNVTGTAKARFQKWLKMFPEVTGQVNSYEQIPFSPATGFPPSNVRVQVKGVLEWTGDDEFYKMVIFSNNDIKISP